MTLRSQLLAAAGLLVTLAASPRLVAQAPDDPAGIVRTQEREAGQLAAEWLASGDPRVRAWGAYVAARDRQRQLGPNLAALAQGYRLRPAPGTGTDRDEHNAMLSVLDAIIQLNTRLPPSAAAALYPEFPTQSLILLSSAYPAADVQLLDIFQHEATQPGAWLAAGNLLMRHGKVFGFAAALFGGLTVQARVRVVDGGSGPDMGYGYGGSCAFGGVGPIKSGWPEVGNYFISTRGMLLVSGADPSFYQRNVSGPDPVWPHADFVCDDMSHAWDPDYLRTRFLAKLAGESPDQPSVRWSVAETITWRTDAQYLTDLRSFIRGQHDAFDALSARLVDSGWLSADEQKTARPTLDVQISDARTQGQKALPSLAEGTR